MAKTKQKAKQTESTGKTVSECPTNAQAKAAFLKQVEEGGHPDTVSKVVYALDFLLAAGRPFTETDLFNGLRQFDIEDIAEVQRLFKKWREVMERLSKITVVRNGVYDSELVVPVG